MTGDAAADELLNTDGLALLIGMLLDQQVPMEWAFMGPASLRRVSGISTRRASPPWIPTTLVAVFCAKPALHRYPAVMARRTHDLCAFIVEHYDGKAERLWEGVDSGAELYARLRELPGYGQEKARIFVAILAKRRSVRPAGWEAAAGPFADPVPRSVADIDSPESLAQRPRVEEGPESRQEGQARPPPQAVAARRARRHAARVVLGSQLRTGLRAAIGALDGRSSDPPVRASDQALFGEEVQHTLAWRLLDQGGDECRHFGFLLVWAD